MASSGPSTQGTGEGNILHISKADLPAGVEAAEGTKLTFCITGPPDADGDIPGYFETDGSQPQAEAPAEEAGEGGDDNQEMSWEDEFMHHMSPRSQDQEAQ